MAMVQRLGFTRLVRGDGSSTTLVVDFAKDIAASNILGYPIGVASFTPGGLASATLAGSKVTFTWTSPMDEDADDTIGVYLKFAGN